MSDSIRSQSQYGWKTWISLSVLWRGRYADEMDALTKEVAKCDRFIEKQFDEFIFEWPAEAEGLDATLAAASDFFAKLTRLETDGLPAHEQRFFELAGKSEPSEPGGTFLPI